MSVLSIHFDIQLCASHGTFHFSLKGVWVQIVWSTWVIYCHVPGRWTLHLNWHGQCDWKTLADKWTSMALNLPIPKNILALLPFSGNIKGAATPWTDPGLAWHTTICGVWGRKYGTFSPCKVLSTDYWREVYRIFKLIVGGVLEKSPLICIFYPAPLCQQYYNFYLRCNLFP